MENIPDHLKQKFVPRLKDQFRKIAEMAAAADMDPSLLQDGSFAAQARDFHREMGALYDDFERDGGTEEHWNRLAPAVHKGDFGPY
jgi:hypothetical protein